MPDGHVAAQRAQLLLVEHLVDEALVAHRHDVAALGCGDACRLLAPVLQRVQSEVRETGDIRAWGMDAEHAALVARSVTEVEHGSSQDSDGIGDNRRASGLSAMRFPHEPGSLNVARKQMMGVLGALGLAAAIAAPAQAASWTPVATGTTEDITAIEYQGADRFWFTTGSGKIFKRVGDAFVQVENAPAVVFRDIEFQDGGNVGLAVGTNGGVYRSTNAGSTWDPVAILLNSHPTNPNDCNEPAVQPLGDADSVNFNGDGTRAWVTATGSQIAVSAGTNLTVGSAGMWTDANKSGSNCKVSGDVDDSFPVAGSDGVYFVGKSFGEMFFTANNLGSTASKKAAGAGNGFEATRRLAADPGNPNRQWSVAPNGGGGSYYKRTENGWSGADDWEIANPDAGSLTKAHDVDSRGGTVVSVGEGGTILHSIDGRTFFHSPAAGLTEDWHAVSVADGANAAVGGTNGKLVLSTTANVTPDIVKPTGTIAGPASTPAGRPVAFTLNAADEGGSGLNAGSFAWTSAGLPGASGNPATFTFPSPGFYTVKVTFADNAGNTAEATRTIQVTKAVAGSGPGITFPSGGATAKIVGNRVRVRARGTVALPPGAPCSGKVKLTVKKQRKTVAKRSVQLKRKSGKCRFGRTIFIKRSKIGRTTTRLRLKVAIKGNAALKIAPLTKTLVIKK
jgi:hypothetical protein